MTKPKNEQALRTNLKAETSKPKNERPSSVDLKQQQTEWMSTIKWKVTFLSTLTHALYISERPFEDFRVCSPEFLVTMQVVFNLVFPEIVYKLSPSDAMVKIVMFLFLLLPSCANHFPGLQANAKQKVSNWEYNFREPSETVCQGPI